MKYRIRRVGECWQAERRVFLFFWQFMAISTGFSPLSQMIDDEKKRLGIVDKPRQLKLYVLFFKLLVSMLIPTRWNKIIVVDTEARTYTAHLYHAKSAFYEPNCDEFIIYIC